MRNKGMIFDIQRFSLYDGPGIRTTVFFKGCPLNCIWCHNPEGIGKFPVLSFREEKCAACGGCTGVCPGHAHSFAGDRHFFNRDICVGCGLCAAECVFDALELAGREAGGDEIMEEVLRDIPFYETSGGGMTVSGGEPLMQPEFLLSLLESARGSGIHCCLETCGFANWDCLEKVLGLTDLFLFDLKETDPVRHKEYTGVSNDVILDNLKQLHGSGASIILRLPIVPGYNDRADHFDGIAALCRRLPDLRGVEIMPYHGLGAEKVARFGLDTARRAESSAPDRDTIERWKNELIRRGVETCAG